MEQAKQYNGFKVESIHDIKELDATMYLMEHIKSGAKLCYLDYEDTNKVFSITFNTTPKNDTGVFHILEHSVLNGSEKYPLKEPFVDLMKGSMQTFLNAMTFPDKTIYPFASQNDKDFMNLMDVYLDAVFHPIIYKKKEIFMQEGWHSVWSEEQQDVLKTGVVYNEMKGVFSDPTQCLSREVYKTLFPDTEYRYVSGGNPEAIPELTYEQFIETHRNHYYPGNSYIFLGGKMDIEEKLRFLDENYLGKFEKKDRIPYISIQKPTGNNNYSVIEYPKMPQIPDENSSFFALSYVIDKADNIELGIEMQILKYILFDCRTASIRQRVLQSGLAKDIKANYDNSVKQPIFSITAYNTDETKQQAFLNCVKQGFEDVVKNGLDEEFIEAAISHTEFQLREDDFGNYPKGLIYNFGIMGSWLHGWLPETTLRYEKEIAAIKEKFKNGYFEKLIKEYLLDSNHSSFIVLKPAGEKNGVGERNKTIISDKEKEIMLKENEDLRIYQSQQDTEEVINKIPKISLSDIPDKPEHLPMDIDHIGHTPVFYHNAKTKGIACLNLYFSLAGLDSKKIKYLELFSELVGNVATKKYSKEQLENKKGKLFASLYCNIEVFDNGKGILPVLVISAKALENNLKEALELLEEVIYESDYSDLNDIGQALWMLVSHLEIMQNNQGNATAERRIMAHYSQKNAYVEYVNGVEGYKFLKSSAVNFPQNAEELVTVLKEISKQILCKDNVIFSYTGSEEGYEAFKTIYSAYKNEQHNEFKFGKSDIALLDCNREALYSPSQVQYVGIGGNFKKCGFKYSGKLKVAGRVLSLSYLWNEVRVKGGAYGSNFNVDREGNCIFTSFRDPNLSQTLDRYKRAAEYLKSFEATKDEMDKFIIGTISGIDKPKSKSFNGYLADKRYFEGVTEEEICNERKEILSATVEDIKGFSTLVEEIIRQNEICVVGNKEKIDEESGIFEKIQPLQGESM